jgi:hypothetical protein
MSHGHGWRPVIALLVGTIVAGVTLLPPVNRLLAHLPQYGPMINRLLNRAVDPAEPPTSRTIRFPALRAASRKLPSGATYYVNSRRSDPALVYTLRGVTALYLPASLPVSQPGYAEWILSYQAPRVVPSGLRAQRVFALGGGVYLVKVQRG